MFRLYYWMVRVLFRMHSWMTFFRLSSAARQNFHGNHVRQLSVAFRSLKVIQTSESHFQN